MSASPRVLYVEFHAAPGKRDELRAELQALVAPTLQEAGCLLYDLHQGAEDADVFAFYESWADAASHAAHDLTPHVARIRAVLPGLISGPVRKVWLTKLGSQ